jgi:hypothetical protein
LYTSTYFDLLREFLGTSALKERALVAVGQWSPWNLGKEATVIHQVLMREQCDMMPENQNMTFCWAAHR